GLEAEGQRSDVEQQHGATAAGEDARLDARAERHDLVRVDARERRAAEELFHGAAHERNPRGAADGDDLPDLARLEAGVLKGLPARPTGALDEVAHQGLELLAPPAAPHPLPLPSHP